MNPGQHHFSKTVLDQIPDLPDDLLRRRTSTGSPDGRNDAIAALGITAVLYFDKRTRTASDLVSRTDIEATNPLKIIPKNSGQLGLSCRSRSTLRMGERNQVVLVGVSRHHVHSSDGGQGRRVALGVAAGHHQAGLWILPMESSNQLANLLIGAVGDRTRIDDYHVGLSADLRFLELMLEKVFPNSRAVGLVGPATERGQVEFLRHDGGPARSPAIVRRRRECRFRGVGQAKRAPDARSGQTEQFQKGSGHADSSCSYPAATF